LRAKAPVHKGSVRELMGYPPHTSGALSFRRGAPVYCALSYEANDIVLRENEVFSSNVYAGRTTALFGGRTILEMTGDEHRRYRALVQHAFSPRRAQWWIDNWIQALVDEEYAGLQAPRSAEPTAELCARIPLQTITSSFGLTGEEALGFRERAEPGMTAEDEQTAMMERHKRATEMLSRVIEERRREPKDDVITVLVQSEIE